MYYILFEGAFISFGAPDCAATIRGRRLIGGILTDDSVADNDNDNKSIPKRRPSKTSTTCTANFYTSATSAPHLLNHS